MPAQASLNKRLIAGAEILLIITTAFIPLFSSFPYRINIFLSWEGAYRLSIGQVPYKDFGLPLGYGFWLIPALFFKIFGPAMITLVKAQIFINILSGFAFRSILKSLQIHPIVRFVSLLLYILSFSFINFWPWYNHTVIVYEFIGLAFLFKYLLPNNPNNLKGNYAWLILSGLFIFLSFFTKQDGGGLALLLCLALLLYHCLLHKKITPLAVFIASCFVFGVAFILPFSKYNFGYWFNHGQPPHSSRINLSDLVSDLFGNSQWLKFYVVLFIILLIPSFRQWKTVIKNERQMLLILLVSGICAEALIFQFTSYIPPDNNIFFHSFCFMFLLTVLQNKQILSIKNNLHLAGLSLLVLFLWSSVFWRYIARIFPSPQQQTVKTAHAENVISRKTYLINPDTTNVDESQWKFSSLPVFKKIYMPPSTINGINRLLANPSIHVNSTSKVLNMTELTPLSYLMGFNPETGPNQPLWYHLGVGMFNKQRDMFCSRIANNYYSLVLFENIPTLNNFFPFAVRDSLRQHYRLADSFLAPRRPTNALIEVYLPKN